MTPKQLSRAFDRHDDEFLKFERVVNPRHPRPDLCAFLMLHDIDPQIGKDMVTAAEHDEIWLCVDVEKLAAAATEDIVRDLVRCGVRIDDDGNLCMFV